MYFSNLVFALNLFRITPFVNTALYLGNIASLIGFLVLLNLNPEFLYVNFKELPVSKSLFNGILVVLHVFPVYMFRERQTLRETFAPNTIAALAGLFLLYLFTFKSKIKVLYGISVETMAKMAVGMGLFFLAVGAIFFWEPFYLKKYAHYDHKSEQEP
jgi:hypothetical protein